MSVSFFVSRSAIEDAGGSSEPRDRISLSTLVDALGSRSDRNFSDYVLVREEGESVNELYNRFLNHRYVENSNENTACYVTNFELIQRKWGDRKNKKHGPTIESNDANRRTNVGDIEIREGTTLYMAQRDVEAKRQLTFPTNHVTNFNAAFFAKALKDLYNDPQYEQARKTRDVINTSSYEDSITVLLYSKSMSGKDIIREADGTSLISIGRYVTSCQIETNMQTGGFRLTLSPLDSNASFLENDVFESTISHIHKEAGADGINRNIDLFSILIQKNDLVYIKFENLQNESQTNKKEYIFDMIGLVDTVISNKNYQSTDHAIVVAGRDFRKVLQEDTATTSLVSLKALANGIRSRIVTPVSCASLEGETNEEKIARTEAAKTDVERRTGEEYAERITDLIEQGKHLRARNLVSIYTQVVYDVISGMATLDSLLRIYLSFFSVIPVIPVIPVRKNETTTRFVNDRPGFGPPLGATTQQEVVTTQRTDYVPDPASNPLQGVFDRSELCVDSYAFEDRNFFSKERAAVGRQDNQTSRDVLSFARGFVSQLPRLGIWQVVKLLIEPVVGERILLHTNFTLEHNNAYNVINKFLHIKFVEFFCDVYGKHIYLIFRKPPFDSAAFPAEVATQEKGEEATDETISISPGGTLVFEQQEIAPRQQSQPAPRRKRFRSAIINVNESDVVNESLQKETEAYSYYKIEPSGFQGITGLHNIVLSVEAYYNAYSNLNGNKALVVQYPYIPLPRKEDRSTRAQGRAVNGKQQPTDYSRFVTLRLMDDLAYLVESHQYLPFSRRGTIELYGDRRIKMGTFIYYAMTDEIYYVDAVANVYRKGSNNFARRTVLTVSRGLRREYIKGKGTVKVGRRDVALSYFNIIDLERIKEILRDPSKQESDLLSITSEFERNSSVNRPVYDFFQSYTQSMA